MRKLFKYSVHPHKALNAKNNMHDSGPWIRTYRVQESLANAR